MTVLHTLHCLMHDVYADRSWWGLLPLRTDSPFYAPEGSTVADSEFDGAFVNAGTHQVPLFHGIPPVDLLESFDPFEMLLSKLRQNQPSESVGCFCSCSMASVAVDPCPDEFGPPMLSASGASAIIRLVDSKMVRFSNNHIKVDNQMPITTSMMQIINAQAGGNLQKRRFEYNPLKYEVASSVASEMLVAFQKEPGLLTDAIKKKAEKDVQEYVDSL